MSAEALGLAVSFEAKLLIALEGGLNDVLFAGGLHLHGGVLHGQVIFAVFGNRNNWLVADLVENLSTVSEVTLLPCLLAILLPIISQQMAQFLLTADVVSVGAHLDLDIVVSTIGTDVDDHVVNLRVDVRTGCAVEELWRGSNDERGTLEPLDLLDFLIGALGVERDAGDVHVFVAILGDGHLQETLDLELLPVALAQVSLRAPRLRITGRPVIAECAFERVGLAAVLDVLVGADLESDVIIGATLSDLHRELVQHHFEATLAVQQATTAELLSIPRGFRLVRGPD